MTTFDKYAAYYNLLYEDKSYDAEVEYILRLLKAVPGFKPKSLLDIGSGTGHHAALFQKNGFEVTGLELSEEMLKSARATYSDIDFFQGDFVDFDLNKKFDVVTSLFHVINYQVTNERLESSIFNASRHLNQGGVFVFDFWFGPAVLTDPPVPRIKKLQNKDYSLTRFAEPVHKPLENIIEVHYEVLIESKNSLERIEEIHRMRYLFIPELQQVMQRCNLVQTKCLAWMSTDDSPSEKSWYAVMLAVKS